MPKTLLLLSFVFSIVGSLLFPALAKAEVITFSIAPRKLSLDQTIFIEISNLPKTKASYNLTVMPAGEARGGTAASIQLWTEADGNCSARVTWPEEAWRMSCSGSGPYSFTGALYPSKMGGANTQATVDLSYTIFLGGQPGGNNLGEDSFTIKAPKASSATFKIDSLDPNPAKPGENVNINLSGTKQGSYVFGISNGQLNPGQNCSGSTCALVMKVPNDITSPNANIIVIDPDRNQQSKELQITLPNIRRGELPVVNPQPYKPQGCVNGKDAGGKPCTSSGGIHCNPDNPNVDPKTGLPNPQEGDGIMTAIGCIPTKPEALIQGLFRVALGAGGAVGLLLLIGGSFQMITSAGNPEGVKKGSEMMTSAVEGILIVIFSVFLLQVIGVDILQLPGFGK